MFLLYFLSSLMPCLPAVKVNRISSLVNNHIGSLNY
jgi:hypothetical protein